MDSETKNTALNEKTGVEKPEIVSNISASQIQKFRKKQPTTNELVEGILKTNITSISRAITLIESQNLGHLDKANEVVNFCLPYANKSVRIGITGVPGVGKSTFIEAFGKYLTSIGKKVAVLAVDPSSSLSFGSILGDKTRMEELVNDKNAFIRPSAAGDTLGGVARKTRESITICEAAGYDVIIIETVGVGQSETAVHSMVDFFLLLKIAGAGDELQGIKRGIMEMADAIIINKADGDNVKKANMAKSEFKKALHLFPEKNSGWVPIVITCSAVEKKGIEDVWKIISDYLITTKSNNYFENKRQEQSRYWMMETINDHLKTNFYQNPEVTKHLKNYEKMVAKEEISPFLAAKQLIKKYNESL